MKIYYVCDRCRVVGPAFLRLTNNEYLEDGDICIVSTENRTIAYLLLDNQQSWEYCKIIDSVPVLIKEKWSNFLLYSYNGYDKRKGNISALITLSSIFKATVLGFLFKETIEILKYQKDCMDVEILLNVYNKNLDSPVKIQNEKKIKKTNNVFEDSNKKPFISFLNPKIKNLVGVMVEKGNTCKEIISNIRSSFPNEFRDAFVEYNRYNPTGSIFNGLREYFFVGKKDESENEYADSVLSDNKYVKAFLNLHVDTNGKEVSPQKPILLLAIIDLIEVKEILSPFIPISKDLENHYIKTLKKYVFEEVGHRCELQYPFINMKSECFWILAPMSNYEKKSSYSLSDLRKNYYGAIIDRELFEMICDDKKREILQKILVSNYLQVDSSLIEVNNDDLKEETSLIFNKKYGQDQVVESNDNSEIIKDLCVTNFSKNVLSKQKKREKYKLPYGAKIKQIISKDFKISGGGNSSNILYDFIVAVGVKKVYDLKIPFLRGYLVDKTRNLTYISNCKYIEGGYWLNTTGSLGKKIEHIQLIADYLNIEITIEVCSKH